jgi:hypothetical protein
MAVANNQVFENMAVRKHSHRLGWEKKKGC